MSGTCCTPCQPFTERHGHRQRVLPGTRGRTGTQRVQRLVLDARACARSGRARRSPQCQHMAGAASRSGATHTELVPPRPRACDARDAREHTSHGPRSAWSASAADPGGRSGRLGASDRARGAAELRPHSRPKTIQNYHFLHTKTSPDPKKIIQNFLPPPLLTPRANVRTFPSPFRLRLLAKGAGATSQTQVFRLLSLQFARLNRHQLSPNDGKKAQWPHQLARRPSSSSAPRALPSCRPPSQRN